MDRTQLKQRIVGAIVLVGLGVIFIPIILERDDTGISGSNIPPMPEPLVQLSERELPPPPPLPEKPATVREPVDELTPPQENETTTSDDKPKATATTPSEPVTASKATPSPARAWVVQVASFSERNKALAMRDRLRKANYTSFVESITSNSTVLYRVRVGPVVKRSEAEILQKKIVKQFNFDDALVMSHP